MGDKSFQVSLFDSYVQGGDYEVSSYWRFSHTFLDVVVHDGDIVVPVVCGLHVAEPKDAQHFVENWAVFFDTAIGIVMHPRPRRGI